MQAVRFFSPSPVLAQKLHSPSCGLFPIFKIGYYAHRSLQTNAFRFACLFEEREAFRSLAVAFHTYPATFCAAGFPPVLGHWLQIVVSRLLGPLAYATLRDYLEEAPLLPPETHLELVLHLQPCSFAADCGLHVHVRQDLVNGLPCQVIQSVQMSASTRPCGLVSKTLVLHLACFAYPQLRHAYMHAA